VNQEESEENGVDGMIPQVRTDAIESPACIPEEQDFHREGMSSEEVGCSSKMKPSLFDMTRY